MDLKGLRSLARPFMLAAVLYFVLVGVFAVVYRWFALPFTLNGDPVDLSCTDALYVSAVTMTTLGFGDYVPITASGKLVAAGQAVLGVVFVAVVIGHLAGTYAEVRIASHIRSLLARPINFELAAIRDQLLDLPRGPTTGHDRDWIWLLQDHLRVHSREASLHDKQQFVGAITNVDAQRWARFADRTVQNRQLLEDEVTRFGERLPIELERDLLQLTEEMGRLEGSIDFESLSTGGGSPDPKAAEYVAEEFLWPILKLCFTTAKHLTPA